MIFVFSGAQTYVGHDSLQAYSTQNGILMVLAIETPFRDHFYSMPFWTPQKPFKDNFLSMPFRTPQNHLNTIFIAYLFGPPKTIKIPFSQYYKIGPCRGTWPV